MSTQEENKQLERRFVEEWNRGNLDGVYALFAQDFAGHDDLPGLAPGLEGLKQALRQYFDAFPDSQITLEFLLAEDDKVAGYGVLTGTHKGNLFGIPPTGKKVTIPNSTIHRIKHGKIVEGWNVSDFLGALRQIGALPAPQSARP